MGSKKLKAIAVFGDKKLPVFDEDKHRAAARRWLEVLKETPYSAYNTSRDGGLPRGDYKRVKQLVGICAYNCKTTQFPDFLTGIAQQKVTPKPCYACPIGCCYDVEIVSGPYKGFIGTMSGGGEAMEGSAAIVGVSEPGTVIYLTDLYDRMGMDGSTAGCTIGIAFEAYEKGLITKEDTDGLELKWGDVGVIEKVIRKYVNREGFGDILARGPKATAEYIGHGAADFAIHVKGTGLNLHDWRASWGILLGNIVSTGGGWHSPGAEMWRPEADAGYPEKTNSMAHKGKGEEVARCAAMKCMNDSLGVCWFASWGIPGILELSANAISAITGWELTAEDMRRVGQRVLSLERSFNVRQGLTPEDDYNVSSRVIEAPADGPAKGKSIEVYLRGMINDYYRTMGWDQKTGKPYRSTLERLGMPEIAKDLWG